MGEVPKEYYISVVFFLGVQFKNTAAIIVSTKNHYTLRLYTLWVKIVPVAF